MEKYDLADRQNCVISKYKPYKPCENNKPKQAMIQKKHELDKK